jgi:hypothetical protein
VSRRVLALLVAAVALGTPLSSGAYGGGTPSGTHATAEVTGKITLRARYRRGPWRRSLSLRLVKLRLTDFSLCGIWNPQAGAAFDCNAAARNPLPEGTLMRLEQNPVAKTVRRADSPGWGMLGGSANGGIGAVVSNLLSGNRRGTFRYRVTLRDRSNKILVTSNIFTVEWR